jgi:hypothetical protein
MSRNSVRNLVTLPRTGPLYEARDASRGEDNGRPFPISGAGDFTIAAGRKFLAMSEAE